MRLIQGFVPTTAVQMAPISACANRQLIFRGRRKRQQQQKNRRHSHLLHSCPHIGCIESFEMPTKLSSFSFEGDIAALPTTTVDSSLPMLMPMIAQATSSNQFHSTRPAGGDASTTLILAGLSVLISMASLILSIQTWRRHSNMETSTKMVNENAKAILQTSSTTPSAKSSMTQSTNSTSLYHNNDILSNRTTTIERPTIENQILATKPLVEFAQRVDCFGIMGNFFSGHATSHSGL